MSRVNKPVNPKGNQSRIFIERTDAEAEVPILGPPDARANLLEKTLMLGKIDPREGAAGSSPAGRATTLLL